MQLNMVEFSYITLQLLTAELEITVGPLSNTFRELALQIQFARPNLLHNFNGEANDSLYKSVPTFNEWPINF